MEGVSGCFCYVCMRFGTGKEAAPTAGQMVLILLFLFVFIAVLNITLSFLCRFFMISALHGHPETRVVCNNKNNPGI